MSTTLDAGDERLRTVRAIRALARISRALERSSDELNLAHYRVLSAVASGDERASRVAARLALGKPAVSAAVDALVGRSLLLRTEVEGDQRAVALSLTPMGEAVLERVETEMAERMSRLAARTPDDRQVIEAIGWLGDALDAAMAEREAAERAPARAAEITPSARPAEPAADEAR